MEYPFQFRRATQADREAISAMALAVDAEDYIPVIYDELVGEKEPGGLYVTEQGGEMVACHTLTLTGEDDAYLWAMRVHPDYQGRGLGTQICLAQIEQARQAGRENLYLLSERENFRAHRLVERCGYENLGEWIVYGDVEPVSQPAPVRARAADPADLEPVRRMLHAQQGLAGRVIAPVGSPWHIETFRAEDLDARHLAVVEGPNGLEGAMLFQVVRYEPTGEEYPQIRLLMGEPDAAADLLAFAAAKVAGKGFKDWAVSLPAGCEPLLAPLAFDPAQAFHAYVFRFPAGKEAKPR